MRLRPAYRQYGCFWDFGKDRTDQRRPIMQMVVLDELSRDCLASTVARQLGAAGMLEVLAGLKKP